VAERHDEASTDAQSNREAMPFIMAGVPAANRSLYHSVRFAVGDPAALIVDRDGRRSFIVRDIEMERARSAARADEVYCPADFAPDGGLSGDRETATAQAAAQCCRRLGVMSIRADRTLPLSFHHELQAAGVEVVYDPELGVIERRAKDDQEIAALAKAQSDTEAIVRRVCEIIAEAKPNGGGVLQWSASGTLGDGESGDLTAERLRRYIDVQLLRLGYDNPHGSIVAAGVEGGDCHNRGAGSIRTGEAVIIDVFPRSKETLYHGDCTRTVVNGEPPSRIREMHEAVVEAKAAATAAVAVGASGETIQRATAGVIASHGFPMGLPPSDVPDGFVSMPHGTGHGIGLDVHEPPLLDNGGPPLIAGDAITIEPGLYGPRIGGVRVEDLVVVTTDGALSLSSLPEGLDWA